VGAILLAIFAVPRANPDGHTLATVGYTALALFFGATLILAVTAPPHTLRERAFANPVLRILGRYSYAIYVFHLPLWSAAVRHGLVSPERLPYVAGSQMPAQAALIVALSTLSLAAGWLSWHLYEKHFLRLKVLFPYRTRRAAAPLEEAMRQEGDAFAAP
jgi:peptidoglycan/LPS O-acetylase OafA/YrhL